MILHRVGGAPVIAQHLHYESLKGLVIKGSSFVNWQLKNEKINTSDIHDTVFFDHNIKCFTIFTVHALS